MDKGLKRALYALHILVGIGAMAGGLGAILNPQNPMGIGTEQLRRSPFDDYLIPGIFLFSVIGLGNLVAFAWQRSGGAWHGYVSGAAGGILVAWIVIQCYMLQAVAVLHVLFFLIGGIVGLLALTQLYREDRFPFPWIRNWLMKQERP